MSKITNWMNGIGKWAFENWYITGAIEAVISAFCGIAAIIYWCLKVKHAFKVYR